MFPIVRVDRQQAESIEPLGTKRKYWFTDELGRRILFKAEERGTGEDWAEKIACELADLLGLPHVRYDLAEEYDLAKETERRTPGVVCETFIRPPCALVLGNEFLLARDSSYPAERRFKLREHTVAVVAKVIKAWELPQPPFADKVPAGLATALDVFVGYVMFDAWVANQDRHHENWAAVREGERFWLAPTFDHGASMARNLTDKERHERLATRDANRQIPAFARKALSAFYDQSTDDKPMTTVAAWRAFAKLCPHAASAWLERLQAIGDAEIERLLKEIPPHRMSEICRQFTMRLLQENRRRLFAGDEK
jgi:hypothetical protein